VAGVVLELATFLVARFGPFGETGGVAFRRPYDG